MRAKLDWEAWSDDLSVGIAAIDDDHRGILDLIAHLHEAYDSDHGTDAVRLAVGRIAAYAETHFQREERMLLLAGYPYLIQHRARHDAFRAYVANIVMGASPLPEVGELLSWLVDWWVGHIGTEDKQYRDHVQSRPDAVAAIDS
ncbi:bacteriohemerythrin [Magnetospirillum aberrantis]|uniref:Hemerythrin family protein n=1 Tax=Magnetospirillum aberrantis SpK TaxID=908842 RepID=A0A7C9QWS3_9PROT|nr:hemerythrin family protein [Magnetospirillum aberrantis]NFV82039.1 hemerythrin family protein [Magnetospirillum aberrantis SpK]